MSVPAEGKPEFVMTGFTKPDGSVRLYASRSVEAPHWDILERHHRPVWHLDADLDQMLVIDAPNWRIAYARLFTIWENQDKAGLRELPGGPKSLTGPVTP